MDRLPWPVTVAVLVTAVVEVTTAGPTLANTHHAEGGVGARVERAATVLVDRAGEVVVDGKIDQSQFVPLTP